MAPAKRNATIKPAAEKSAKSTAPKKGSPAAEAADPKQGESTLDRSAEGGMTLAKSESYDWLVERLNKRTGELEKVAKYKYLEGNPKQYRSDSKAGEFNLNGGAGIGDTFTFQPIAWRLFEDDILNSGLKRWFELFFIDDKACVSAIIFHGFSVENLVNMAAPLFYDEITLADVVITAKHVMHESKAKEAKKAKFSIVEFSYELAKEDLVKELDAYCQEHKIYRRATLTSNANFETVHNYHNPLEEGQHELEEGEQSEEAE